MQNSLKYAFILSIGLISFVVGVDTSPSEKDDFFGQLIAIEKPIEDLKESIEKKQYEKALSLLQKIQSELDYIQTAADNLRGKIISLQSAGQKSVEKNK